MSPADVPRSPFSPVRPPALPGTAVARAAPEPVGLSDRGRQLPYGFVLGGGRQLPRPRGEFTEGGRAGQLFAAQCPGEPGGDRGHLEALAVTAPQRSVDRSRRDRAPLLVRCPGPRVQPAHGGRRHVPRGARPEPYGVERGHRVAGADLAAVDAVVAEVLVGDLAVLVPDEFELLDGLRVEGDLGLGVARRQFEVGGQLVDEDLAGLLLVGDVGGVAVALVGELLHERVAVVAADADPEEGDAVVPAG